MSGEAPDRVTREAVVAELDATLFVEASAGSGKTTQLVARLLELVCSGRATIDQVAAITFTEAAAAELRDRLAEQLELAARPDPRVPPEEAERSERARAAVSGLDAAAITTLHGFARRVLAEHPLDAGLPPVFEVLDAFGSLVDFDERWDETVDRLLEDPDDARCLQLAMALGVTMRHLRAVAQRLEDNWDLLGVAGGPPSPVPAIDTDGVLGPLRAAMALEHLCTDPEDRLLGHLRELEPWAARLADCSDDVEVISVLSGWDRKISSTWGKKDAWHGRKQEVVDLLAEAQDVFSATRDSVGQAVLAHLAVRLSVLTLGAAQARRREGRLRFHDLLVLARDLVAGDAGVQRELHDQYRYLLVDEFQDTDPIQAELAVRIASVERGGDWTALPVEPGRLFFVGDPKQSIYRFRRADVELFETVRERLVEEPTRLTTNFRSVPGVLAWVDEVVGCLLGEGYPPSSPHRPAHPGPLPVVVLGSESGGAGTAEEARLREAAEVTAAVLAARDEQWPVGEDGLPARLRDIAVLVPKRALVPFLEEAFDDAGIAYRLQSSSLVYHAPEVRSLLAVLQAIDDPSDAPSVIAALRSPAFGCGDDDLLRHRMAQGSWDCRRATQPDGPVAEALAALRGLHEVRWWTEVSELVGRVIEERHLLGLALDGPQWRDGWRRLRFVLDQARQFTETSSGDLRRFLAWVERQSEEDVRVTEVVLPETDLDAVSVLTVHAAKGLEWPVVVVAGLGGGPHRRGTDVLFGPGDPELSIRQDLTTAGWDPLAAVEDALAEDERRRLLYVATTRARDHLVVSVHRGQKDGSSLAALVHDSCMGHLDCWRTLDGPASPAPAAGVPAVGETPAATATSGADGMAEPAWGDAGERERWRAAWEQRTGAEPSAISATAVAHRAEPSAPEGDDKDESPDREPWRRGRAGTAVGRAVHATLQVVDLATGEGLSEVAAAQASAENVPARAAEVERLARAALDSDVVRAAVQRGRYWRELYVGVPVGERVLEGVVDLLVDGEGGLEVVDYKTDRVESDAEVDRAMVRHRLQGAAYALAVAGATGRPVTRCTFLFLRPRGAVARPVDDLEAATEEVRHLLTGS
ncbi:MAG: UvrD-helicase domain-containing protein [Acidimicrobiales bacterium]